MAEPRHRPIPAELVQVLRCPVCSGSLHAEQSRLTCSAGHGFDRARQGYVTLRGGHPMPRNADTTSMVEARDGLLGSGLYDRIREQVAGAVAGHAPAVSDERPRIVADLAGGTGYYLAGMLDRLPDALGLCLDVSTPALRRAARSHDRALAIGADLLRGIPLVDDSIAVAASVFGPRNVPEIRRVLQSDGALVVVTPTAEHLHEVIEPLGMVTVHQGKDDRLDASLSAFTKVEAEGLQYTARVTRAQARLLAAMGPSARHMDPADLDAKALGLPEALDVTVSVNVRVYRK